MAFYFPPSFPSHYANEIPLINPLPVYIDDPDDPRLRTYTPARAGPINKGLLLAPPTVPPTDTSVIAGPVNKGLLLTSPTDTKADNSAPRPFMNPSPFMPGASLFDPRWPLTEMIRGPVTIMLPRSDRDLQIEQKRLDQLRDEQEEAAKQQEEERLRCMSKKKKRRRRRKHRNNPA